MLGFLSFSVYSVAKNIHNQFLTLRTAYTAQPRRALSRTIYLAVLLFGLTGFAQPAQAETYTFPNSWWYSAPAYTTNYADSDGTFTLAWTFLELPSGGDDLSFTVYKKTGGTTTYYSTVSSQYSFNSLPVGTHEFWIMGSYWYDDGWDYYQETSCSRYKLIITVPAPPPPIPGVPSMNMATTDSDGYYSISWGSVTNATSYQWQERVDGGSWSSDYTTSSTSASRSSRGNGVWGYRVRACNTSGCSAYSSERSVIVAITPGVPSSISASPNPSGGDVTVNWGAASGLVTSYDFDYKISSSGTWTNGYDGAGLSTSLTGLSPGTWNYQVRACNTVSTLTNCSGWRTGSSTIITPPSPAELSIYRGSNYQIGDFDLVWTDTWNNAQYYIYERINGGDWAYIGSYDLLEDEPDATYYTKYIRGRIGGVYSYNVVICYQGVCGEHSNDVTIAFIQQPGEPSSISVSPTNSRDDQVQTVSWGPASGTFTGYELEYTSTPTGTVTVYLDTQTTSYQTPANLPAADYTFSVKACNQISGYQACSNAISINASRSPVPETPTLSSLTSVDGVFTVSYITTGLSENIVNQLYQRRDGGGWVEVAPATYGVSAFSETINVTQNGRYEYYVTSCNSGVCGSSEVSSSITVIIPPVATASVVASLVSSNCLDDINVSWSASSNANQYEIQRQRDGGSFEVLDDSLVSTEYLDESTSFLGSYKYHVRARYVSDFYMSDWSPVAESNVIQKPACPPINIEAPGVSHDGVYQIDYTDALTQMGFFGYGINERQATVYERANNGTWVSVFSSYDLGVYSVSPPKTTGIYDYYVQLDFIDDSMSTEITTVTVVRPPSEPALTASVPAIAPYNCSQVDLQWLAGAAGYPVDSTGYFDIEVSTDNENWTTDSSLSGITGQSSTQVSGLEGNTTYYFRIHAYYTWNDAFSGSSEWVTANATTAACPQAPSVPENISIINPQPDYGRFTVDWDSSTGAVDYYQLEENGNVLTLQIADTEQTLSSRLPNQLYSYRVRACSIQGTTQAEHVCSAFSSNSADITLDPPGATSAPEQPMPPVMATPPIESNDNVGSLAAKFRVDEAGGASYSVDIATAPGTAGVVPQISVDYSSNSGNGIAGKGWSIGGLSAITRCSQTLQIDGKAEPISLTTEDRLCLNGQRLINTNHSVAEEYWQNDSVYKTEIDNYSKVTIFEGAYGSPQTFVVEAKDGSRSYYGQTTDSRIILGTQSYVWSISRFEDSVGNAIVYKYYNDTSTHEQTIQRIEYAFGSGATPNATIDFDYEPRVDGGNGYIAGYLLESSQRLHRIVSTTNGTELRHYEFDYLPVASFGVSKLDSIQECRNYDCYPETRFDWSSTNPGFGEYVGVDFNGTEELMLLDYRPADINGDGKMDLIYWVQAINSNTKTLRYAISDGTALYNRGGITNGNFENKINWAVIDYNGDGRHDVIVKNDADSRYKIYLAELKQDGLWGISGNYILTPPLIVDAQYADVNSDGLVDVVHIIDNSLLVRHLERDLSQPTTSNQIYHFGDMQVIPVVDGYEYQPGIHPTLNGEIGLSWRTFDKSAGFGAADFNGDGRVDTIFADYHGEIEETDNCTINCVYEPVLHELRPFILTDNGYQSFVAGGYNPLSVNSLDIKTVDLNGDGYTDLMFYDSGASYFSLSTGAGFTPRQQFLTGSSSALQTIQFVDLNGDGKTEVIHHNESAETLDAYYWQNGSFSAPQIIRSEVETLVETKPVLTQYGYLTQTVRSVNHLFLDINGDGRQDDVIVRTPSDPNGDFLYVGVRLYNSTNEPIDVITGITDGLGNHTDIQYGTLSTSGHYKRIELDVSIETEECEMSNYEFEGTPSCWDTPITYASADNDAFYDALNRDWSADLPAGSHTLGKGAGIGQGPVFEVMGSQYVVTEVSSTTPYAGSPQGSSSVSYYYGEAKIQASGRGYLGFERITTLDKQTGITTTSHYRQDYPFIGMPLETVTQLPNKTIVGHAENIWQLQGWDGDTNNMPSPPYRPILKKSIEKTYYTASGNMNVAISGNGTVLQTIVTESVYDEYGNVTESTITTDTDDSGTGDVIIKHAVNQYGGNNEEREKGRLSDSTVTTTRIYGDGTPTDVSVRSSSFTYNDASFGSLQWLLRTETIEPGGTQDQTLTTTHSYDNFGNEIRIETQGWDGYNVVTRTSEKVFDASGRYVEREINAYGQTAAEIISRNELGMPTATRDINGVVTNIYIDPLGREYFRSDSTGAFLQTEVRLCSSSSCSHSEALYKMTKTQSGGARNIEYFDRLGRSLRKEGIAFNGQVVYQDTEYDIRGKTQRVSQPYFSTGTPVWMRQTYDRMGRVVETVTKGPDGLDSTSTMEYDGYVTINRNAHNQARTEQRNSLGELMQVTDAMGGQLRYNYDANGNLVHIEVIGNDLANGAPGSIVTTVDYDDMGRKLAMSDPDKGNWSYEYNAFGELIRQIDAKNQRSEQRYNIAGNQVERWDYARDASNDEYLFAHAVWTFDDGLTGNAALLNVTDTANGYTQTYTYDGFGRSDETITTLPSDGTYYAKVNYDQFGRVFQQFDASRTTAHYTKNGIQNLYNDYGYLQYVVSVERLNGDYRDIYYELTDTDASGKPLLEDLGNGYRVTKQYNHYTGMIQQQNVATGFIGPVYDVLQYQTQWDVLGNLEWRQKTRYDNAGTALIDAREDFFYDDLNRLYQAIRPGLGDSEWTYDSFGNIKTQTHQQYDATPVSSPGTYTYGPSAYSPVAGPHAVTSLSDGSYYKYDANGNLTEDSTGRDIEYAPFDKPSLITKGDTQIAFEYGPGRARFKQVKTEGSEITTTLYLGNVERVTLPNGTKQVKHYINGVAILIDTVDSADLVTDTKHHYLVKDHLGSTLIMVEYQPHPEVARAGTNLGIIDMDYSAFGQRRSENYQPLTPAQQAAYDNSVTPRGYTGHEMLDEVGLIHMNGRIYDPILARFVQADPFIQAATNTQSYNRYSYVLNNPMNATDPSGFLLHKALRGMFRLMGPELSSLIVSSITSICIPCGMVLQYQMARAFGASSSDALRSAVAHGASAMAFQAIGDYFAKNSFLPNTPGTYQFGKNWLTAKQIAGQISLHALVGGVSAELQGGKFGHGFAAAFVTKATTDIQLTVADKSPILGVLVAALIGGTTSELTGGKFANGAATAALQFAYNAASKDRVIKNLMNSMKNQARELIPKLESLEGDELMAQFPTRSELGSSVLRDLAVRNLEQFVAFQTLKEMAAFGLALNEEILGQMLTAGLSRATKVPRGAKWLLEFFTKQDDIANFVVKYQDNRIYTPNINCHELGCDIGIFLEDSDGNVSQTVTGNIINGIVGAW
ncbi:MAG: VCBS repeat-containing protein [Gammaproteobacteria bacterium]|nr:VCBS repeat-containing protein [Gammaproteobacteria bacterium]